MFAAQKGHFVRWCLSIAVLGVASSAAAQQPRLIPRLEHAGT